MSSNQSWFILKIGKIKELLLNLVGAVTGGFVVNDAIAGQSRDALTMSLQLGYTRGDVNRLYRAFRKMDTFQQGTVSLQSYCSVNRITPGFGELLFRRMLRTFHYCSLIVYIHKQICSDAAVIALRLLVILSNI